MYEYIDKTIEKVKKNIKAYFQNARLGLLKYDELNKSQIDEEVDDIFDKSLELNDTLLRGMLKDMDLDEDDYPISMLNDRYNTTTNYVFANEFERKRDRYKENIISSIYGVADNQGKRKDFNQKAVISALTSMAFLKLQENNARILAQQIEECAVDDERYLFLQEGIKQGVEYVRWVTAEDERVCGDCGALHNQIFPIDASPDRPHYGCRCELEYVSEEELKELEEIEEKQPQLDIEESSDRTKASSISETGVNFEELKSLEYKDSLKDIPNSQNARDKIYQRIRNALTNRNMKESEEIYAVSLTTGKDVSSITNQDIRLGIERTPKFLDDIKRKEDIGEKILLIHNHPYGTPPSFKDINELLDHKNTVGITAGHNGSIYYYTKPNKEISGFAYKVAKRKNSIYNDDILVREKTLEELSVKYGFEFKRIR